jgi:phage repressor protein C with HTH and peptisase S24 domain
MNHTLPYILGMELKDILRVLMETRGVGQNELADITKVPQPTIFRILKGESKDPRSGTLRPLADYFAVTIAQLRGDDPLPEDLAQLTGVSFVQPKIPAGSSVRVYDNPDELDPESYVWIDRYDINLSAGCGNIQWVVNQKDPICFRAAWFRFKGLPIDDCKALYVRGRSMEPVLQDYDTVLIDTSKKDIVDGDVYALCLEDEFYIKAVHRKPGAVVLRSYNKDFEDIEVAGEQLNHLCVIGKMVWRGG